MRPISGWNSIDITRCGKNLLKYTTRPYSANGLTPVTTKNEDDEVVSIYWSGNTTGSNWFNNANYEGINKYSAFIGTFTLSTENSQMPLIIVRNSSGGIRDSISMEDVPEYTIRFTSEQIAENDTGTWYRLECWPRNTSEKVVDGYVYPMVRFPDDPAGFEPYKGQQISISLPDTFYGGYIDLVTGELVQTLKKVMIPSIGTFEREDNSYKRFYAYLLDAKPGIRIAYSICSCFETYYNRETVSPSLDNLAYVGGGSKP